LINSLDHEHQRIFFFDYDSEKQKLIQQLDREHFEESREKQKLAQQLDRERFEEFWLSNSSNLHGNEIFQKWQKLSDSLLKYNILLPTQCDERLKFLLNALYSAKYGKSIGYKFKALIQVAHQTENNHKEYLRIFGWALKIYGRDEQIKQEDISGKWAKKVNKFKPLMQLHDETYQHDDRFDQLISLLFPELADKL
jgi:hypothetical protein